MTQASDGIPQGSATRRGQVRREQIVTAATALFHRNGFHATGIDDIGAAAGITGPGIYRHFSSKDEILMVVFDRIWLILRDSIQAAALLPPREALELLVETHVGFVVDHRAATTLLLHELRSLPEDYQVKARRNDVTYQDAWAMAIVACNPHLGLDDARIVARSCFWLINSFDDDSDAGRVPPDRAKELLTSMTNGVLTSLNAVNADVGRSQ